MNTDSARAPLRDRFRKFIEMTPSFSVAAIAPLACPACLPALVGILGLFGVSLAGVESYLTPLIAVFVLLALAPLWRRVRRGGEFGPFLLGIVASMIVIVGVAFIPIEPVVFTGAALLMTASVWSLKTMRDREPDACPACMRGERIRNRSI